MPQIKYKDSKFKRFERELDIYYGIRKKARNLPFLSRSPIIGRIYVRPYVGKAYKVVKSSKWCVGCAFLRDCYPLEGFCSFVRCNHTERADKQNIIFVEASYLDIIIFKAKRWIKWKIVKLKKSFLK